MQWSGSRSAKKGRLRVAALLDAAQQVFAQDGFDAATMTEIAARAGASIGSLYQYFPTKEHVADAVLARHAEALYQRMQALQDASPGWTVGQLASELFPALLRFRPIIPPLVYWPKVVVAQPYKPPACVYICAVTWQKSYDRMPRALTHNSWRQWLSWYYRP